MKLDLFLKSLLALGSVIAFTHGAPLVTSPDGNGAESTAYLPLFALHADLQAHLSVTTIGILIRTRLLRVCDEITHEIFRLSFREFSLLL